MNGWRPQAAHAWGLVALLAAAAGPHVLRLPPELVALWLLAIGWRLRLLLQQRPPPAAVLRGLLTLVVALALYLKFGSVLGREAGSALLTMMAGLKLLELKQRRDAIVLVLLAYLLVAVQFMFTRSPWAGAYAVATLVLITTGWIGLGQTQVRSWRDPAALASRMLLQALPMMLVLFVLFPRLPGPLWALPSDAHARTGLSGEMEPGRISALALSDAVAFRADFAGNLPPPAQRYWRGPVFEFTDGRRWWGVETTAPTATAPPIRSRGTAYRYVLTLEPSGTPWLPALEMPTRTPAGITRLPSLELRAAGNIDHLRRDAFVSFPEYRITAEHGATLTRNLQIPALSARMRALARSWRIAASTDREVVSAALRHFNSEPFVYTLNPAALGADPIDEFLFETRRGFCEHYAAAFTLLMRAAGIPARVVTGYQGGEINAVGDYLVVRQSDAHAWSEVWLTGNGWTRVDPTAAVAPDRIERRIDPAWAGNGAAVRFRFDDAGMFAQALRHARFIADAIDNGWNQRVLDYGAEQQRALLAAWGMADAGLRELAWLTSITLPAGVGVLALLLLRRSPPADPVLTLYRTFQHKLVRHGICVSVSEGPRDLMARIEQSLRPVPASAHRIVELYIALRYSARPDAWQIKELRRAVQRFR